VRGAEVRKCLLAIGLVLGLSPAPRAQDAQTSARFARIGAIVDAAIERRELPGAVVLIGEGDRILYRQAFGRRAVEPAPEAMTEDTIFDAASLTKVVATTTSVMQLVEEGHLRLRDPVAKFVPAFNTRTKSRITIGQLLTHTSGLAPDLPLEVVFRGTDEAIRRAGLSTLAATPGTRMIYSDINFFVLGYIVSKVSGEPLEMYVKRHIFEPLQMSDTGYVPDESLKPRIAPTERCAELAWPCTAPATAFLRGTVHDPTARRMGNVAGHAGLFTTAADLARFCRMLLNGGSLDGAHVLSPAAVERMILPSTPEALKDVRGLGWDIDSGDSGNRGDLFPAGTSFGHTGWTGTSVWLDPRAKSYVIFLSNRVHPNGRGDVVALRGQVANVAAAVLSDLRVGR
jgi:CubicO group peptidase (beta-lactamase class C family)